MKLDLLQGTLDLLILRTLQTGPQHGWAISERIQQISRDVLRVNQGSLYPALHRLEHQGWIAAEWGTSELITAGAGIAIGIPAALVATRVVQSLLYGVKTDDMASFLVAASAAATGPFQRRRHCCQVRRGG